MPSPCYRDLRDGDLEAIAAIWAESWRSVGLNIATPLATEQGCQERVRRELEDGWCVTVACETNRVIGFLATKPAPGALDQLFVSPVAKGKGIGTELLRLAMTKMPDGFWLRTAEANQAACAFYEGQGLRRDRTEPHPKLGHATAIYIWP